MPDGKSNGEVMAMQQTPQSMWEEYREGRSPELRRKLALQHLDLVRRIVGKWSVPPAVSLRALEMGDLIQAGVIGLLDAIDRFDPLRGVKFETYAVIRIRGAVQDELRKLDWVPRSVRRKAREVLEAPEAGTPSSGGTMYVQMLLSLDRMDVNAGGELGPSVEELLRDGTPDVLETMGMNELKGILIGMLERLPDDERMILTLYYYENLTFREIGQVLQLSESRVSQKHAATVKRLRTQLEDHR